MRIGILALQGAFAEHAQMLEKLDAEYFEIRKKGDIKTMDGLILPGGESTAMIKLLRELKLYEPLKYKITNGLPVFGTCAGMILMAKKVEGGQECFGCMDVTVKRNAYGRQLGSFQTTQNVSGVGLFPMIFIRGPYITQAGKTTEVLARVSGKAVAVRQDHMLAVSFHPELTQDERMHRYFLKMAQA